MGRKDYERIADALADVHRRHPNSEVVEDVVRTLSARLKEGNATFQPTRFIARCYGKG